MKQYIVVVVAVCLVVGCGSVTEVSSPSNERTDFVANRVYKLKRPVFLYKLHRGDQSEVPKLARLGFSGTPGDAEEFRARTAANSQVLGLLLPGEKVRVTKFMDDRSPTLGRFLHVFGEIVTGEFQGTVVKLNFLTREGGPSRNASVDRDYLVLVE